MKEEIFKDIPDYEGIYQASNLGRIKSVARLKRHRHYFIPAKERILRTQITKRYQTVTLQKNGKRKHYSVHQLVAMSFLNHKPNGYVLVVDHIDNNPLNNNVNNLQLITQRENCIKEKQGNSSKYVGVCFDKARNKWRAEIYINNKKKYLGRFLKEIDAYNAYKKELENIFSTNRVSSYYPK